MSSLTLIDPVLLGLMQSSFSDSGMPIPFLQEIFLLETHIAGTTYLKLKKIEPKLNITDLLVMKREVDNKYDALAIILLTSKGEKLGYIPKDKNEVLARLMDAGKLIFGKIEDKQWKGQWLKLSIKVYMRDI
jgi:hypothetical protein